MCHPVASCARRANASLLSLGAGEAKAQKPKLKGCVFVLIYLSFNENAKIKDVVVLPIWCLPGVLVSQIEGSQLGVIMAKVWWWMSVVVGVVSISRGVGGCGDWGGGSHVGVGRCMGGAWEVMLWVFNFGGSITLVTLTSG